MARSVKAVSLSLFLLIILSATTLFAAFDSAEFNRQNGAIKVIGITPSGADVPVAREIVIHFNRPVVPVGRRNGAPPRSRSTSTHPLPVTGAGSIPRHWPAS